MTGYEYEKYCATYLSSCGFSNIRVTKSSGDQGVDIVAKKHGHKYGIQCKYYSGTVGNRAVQEAYAGAKFYGCDHAIVMTNSVFTPAAKKLADKTGVELWDSIDSMKLSGTSRKLCMSLNIYRILAAILLFAASMQILVFIDTPSSRRFDIIIETITSIIVGSVLWSKTESIGVLLLAAVIWIFNTIVGIIALPALPLTDHLEICLLILVPLLFRCAILYFKQHKASNHLQQESDDESGHSDQHDDMEDT